VLINQAHTYPDLVLSIDGLERHWFEAIDGKHTIEKILRSVVMDKGSQRHLEQARTFFERLWWHDHVVFDASKQSSSVPT
jgi:hypothetical protein